MRYLLTRDVRFSMWTTEAGFVCGLRRWPAQGEGAAALQLDERQLTPVMADKRRPGDAVEAILQCVARPVQFDALLRFVAELWRISELAPVDLAATIFETEPAQLTRIEMRQFLGRLWDEIKLLREPQRAALLLNLRDVDGMNAAALFILIGVATMSEIAELVGISNERMADAWNDLPMDDLTIAELLGVSRQQVINLRKSARERLARRLLGSGRR